MESQIVNSAVSPCAFDFNRRRALFLRAALPGLSFFDDFLQLADFLLDFPGDLFPYALAFQVGIIRQLPGLFLDRALHFVNLARYLIFRTWLHDAAFFRKPEFRIGLALLRLPKQHHERIESGCLFTCGHSAGYFCRRT